MTVKPRRLASGIVKYRASVTVAGAEALGRHGWTDKRTAKADERELHDQRDAGRLAANDKTVAGWLEEYIAGLERRASTKRRLGPNTAAKYRDQARRVASVIGDVRLTALREADVERMRDALIDRGLADSTVYGDQALLGRALDVAERRGLLRVPNPAHPKAVYRTDPKAPPAPVLEPAEARAILEAVVGDPVLDVAVHLALGATLRRAEVLGLRWSAVDLEAGTIAILPGATLTVAGFGDPKSAAGVRVIPAPAFVLEALRRHRDAQAVAPIADALVLSNGGRPYTPTSLSRAWRLFRAAHAELVPAGMTYHDLRHGAGQAMLEAGIAREVVKRVAGWTDDSMPEHYAPTITTDARRHVADALQQQLGPR